MLVMGGRMWGTFLFSLEGNIISLSAAVLTQDGARWGEGGFLLSLCTFSCCPKIFGLGTVDIL